MKESESVDQSQIERSKLRIETCKYGLNLLGTIATVVLGVGTLWYGYSENRARLEAEDTYQTMLLLDGQLKGQVAAKIVTNKKISDQLVDLRTVDAEIVLLSEKRRDNKIEESEFARQLDLLEKARFNERVELVKSANAMRITLNSEISDKVIDFLDYEASISDISALNVDEQKEFLDILRSDKQRDILNSIADLVNTLKEKRNPAHLREEAKEIRRLSMS